MTNPLALLPLAVAASGGSIDEFEAQQLVAAGITLLQRCAPLVRALSGRRSAILLPTSPAYFTALAASDGRGAVLVDPSASPLDVAAQLRHANVGAAFTISALAARLPVHVPMVLLDGAPIAARFVGDGITRDVDLGSHHGLTIEGDPDSPGQDEEAVIIYSSAMAEQPVAAAYTHQRLLANARSAIQAMSTSADDHMLTVVPFSSPYGLVVTGVAPLFAGGRVTTMGRFDASRAASLIASGGITAVAGDSRAFGELLTAWRAQGAAHVNNLRLCICNGAPLDAEVRRQWFDTTGVELRDSATVLGDDLRAEQRCV